ncbi:olfactory receptor 11L1-like [Gopherus evgoodei]|uniref:olfactory receptor 11L1-like n=1 Tax=Gopherus evgoodei TaxID=1825980 RepID=UPI0011CFADEC|nr:olfactory receptor 11L1-like [Gopherus evgoodei]
MVNRDQGNQTSVTEFILLGFNNISELQTLLFLLFLVIYIVTMAGNILIVMVVMADQHLHTPMYFFLGNLSCFEICYTSTILPRMLASLLTGDRTISIRNCFLQYYFFAFLVLAECYLLSVMSYDQYLAICKALRYAALMNGNVCAMLAAASWVSGFLASTIITSLISQFIFCGPNEIDHFFCDFNPIIKLSCSDTHLAELAILILASIFTQLPFLTLKSYVYIILSILRIPSTTGRQKAFSTCSSHLIVVTIFYGTIIIVYLLPKTNTLKALNKVFSVFYTVLTPLVNPLIYSLRNREVKKALQKAVNTFVFSQDLR